jgi:hypothetical protein
MKVKHDGATLESFDNLMSLLSGAPAQFIVGKKESILNDKENYLQRGERLLTLAKERYKENSAFHFTPFEEYLYDIDLKEGSSFITIVDEMSVLVRKILRKAKSPEDATLKEMISAIDPNYGVGLQFVDVAMEPNRVHRKQVAAGDQVILLTIKELDYPTIPVYGLKDHKHTNTRYNQLYYSGACVADIAKVIAYLLFLTYSLKSVKKQQLPVCRMSTSSLLHQEMYDYTKRNGIALSSDIDLMSLWDFKFFVPSNHSDMIPKWEEFLSSIGVEAKAVPYTRDNIKEIVKKKIEEGTYPTFKDVPIILDDSRLIDLMKKCLGDVINDKGYIPYHVLLSGAEDGRHYGENLCWAIPHADACLFNYPFDTALVNDIRINHAKMEILRESRKGSKDHALSFQTKQNIPKATLKAMEESLLNEFFGYVEFDEDVDLQKVSVIAEQFMAFKETFFSSVDASTVSIRFRKLGNHKALGLFYPSVSCLCVDVSSPSSLTHEFGHMIDYLNGNLSLKPEFIKVLNLYEKHISKKMTEDKAFATLMNGKGKYNKSYFLKPTEIFARSFELYCVKVLNVNNSLVPAEDSFGLEYPTTEEYVDLIREYFQNLFVVNKCAA